MTEALLSFHSVTKTYGTIRALEDVSFSINGERS